MSISKLFEVSACCSCGLCCSKEALCEACEISTLRANGIPDEYAKEIHGLKSKSRNHGNGFSYSELYYKINEIVNRLQKEREPKF